MKPNVGKVFIAVGAALLSIAVLGDTTRVGGYKNEQPLAWERFDESLADRSHSVAELIHETELRVKDYGSLSDERKIEALCDTVTDRFTHNAGARHTLFTNWLLYALGKIHPTFGTIMDPEIFVAKGHSLICSQSSYLLMYLALREGIAARHVGLNGHVVMEAWYDDDWHMFDPDMEVVPRNDEGGVLSVDDLAKNSEILKRYYSAEKAGMVAIISSREDNSFVSYPKGAYFVWKEEALFHLEKLAQVLKYLIPALLLFWGIYLQHGKAHKRHLSFPKARRKRCAA